MAGTSDGKELAVSIQKKGFPVLVTVTSAYGESLAAEQGLRVRTGPLDVHALVELVAAERIQMIVDATHPYAVQASATGMDAAEKTGIPYFRYERPASCSEEPFITHFSTMENLCKAVEEASGNIFLTLGSNHLSLFSGFRNIENLYIRILPVPALIEKCLGYGFRSDHILAMQGPFSRAFNEALITQWDISVLVTKDSAGPGGFNEKIEAAKNTGISLFLLNRPQVSYKEAYDSTEILIDRICRTYTALK